MSELTNPVAMLRAMSDESVDVSEVAYRRYAGHVHRYLLRRTGNHSDAEELTQRVFVDAVQSLDRRSEQPHSLLAWLYVLADRRFVDEIRRREQRNRPYDVGGMTGESRTIESQADDRAFVSSLRRSIRRLPREQRDVIVMKVIEGRGFAEIAVATGVSEDACKMRLSRGLRRVRDDLRRDGFAP